MVWLLPQSARVSGAPTRKKGPHTPLPESLPGSFFVLGYDRDRDVYILVLDDEDESSFNLGSDVPVVMRRFEQWGLKDIGNRAIDAAREFRLVQVIPHEGRVIRIPQTDPDGAALIAKQLHEQEQEQGHVRHLR